MELLDANPWMKSTKLVVKPDMLFGKRGKHDLVGLNLDFAGVESFIKARMGKVTRPLLGPLMKPTRPYMLLLEPPSAACVSQGPHDLKALMAVQVVDMDGCIGEIDTFVVEPFVPHKQEYYLSIQVTAIRDVRRTPPCVACTDPLQQ